MKKLQYDLKELPPEFQGAVDALKSKGMPYGWLLRVVDTSCPTAIFLSGGKSNYRSTFPHYVGYWLSGGYGSVQCRVVEELLPGYFWYVFCKEKCCLCPHYQSLEKTLF